MHLPNAESMLVWDNHTCMPLRYDTDKSLPQLERFRAVGTNVVSINTGYGEQGPEQHLRVLAHFRRWILQRPQQYRIVQSAEDIERAVRDAVLGIFFDIEGANAIADQLSLIQLYYDLGVRWMSIAYNRNNRVGGGCMDDDPGLSDFGRAFVDEMERTGMLVCCSHTGARTVRDVLSYARKPVIFSHSNPRALQDHPRNIDDDAILGCAKLGGVVGVNGVSDFLPDHDISARTLARNVDYIANLAGVDHVGIALDYCFDHHDFDDELRADPELFGMTAEQVDQLTIDFAPPERMPEIVTELRALHYSESDIAKIMGGNWMRIAREVWR